MNAKQYLYSIRDEQSEIEELKDRIYEMRMTLYPKGIDYSRANVQTSHSDRMPGVTAEIEDYTNELDNKLARLMKRRLKAQRYIDKLENSCERQILEIYFLSVRKVRFNDIAPMIGYSNRAVYKHYKHALEEMDKIIESVQ